MPEVRVSALGTEAVVDGCLASGTGLAWQRLTALLPSLAGDRRRCSPDCADRTVPRRTSQRPGYSPGVTEDDAAA